jgi:hypothetical protein
MIKLRRMRWAGHVAYMGEKRNACGLLVAKTEGPYDYEAGLLITEKGCLVRSDLLEEYEIHWSMILGTDPM